MLTKGKQEGHASPCSPPSPWSTSCTVPISSSHQCRWTSVKQCHEWENLLAALNSCQSRQHSSSGDEVARTDPVDGHQLTHCLQCVCHALLKRGCGMFTAGQQCWRNLRNTLTTFSGMSPLANKSHTLKNRCMSRLESSNGLKCSLVIPDSPRTNK